VPFVLEGGERIPVPPPPDMENVGLSP
jgi:hypothetical protein